MRERTERFNKAFAHLQGERIIKTQADLAVILKASEGTISRALKGDKNSLTENLLKRFCLSFPIFNLDWLLTGEGEMLKASQIPQEAEKNTESISVQPDIQKWLMKQNEELVALLKQAQATIDRKDQELSELRKELTGDGVIASQKTVEIVESN